MKRPIHVTKYSLLALLILFALLGAFIAVLTYQYEALVRGILGLAVICLIFLYGRSSRRDGSLEGLVRSVTISDFVLAFIWSGLSYWAARQIIDAVVFLIHG